MKHLRRLTSSFITAMAMAAPALAHETEDVMPYDVSMEDVEQMMEVIELTNAQGETVKIAIADSDKYAAYAKKKMQTGEGQRLKQDPGDLDKQLYYYLQDHGFEESAMITALWIQKQYNPHHGYKADMPFPLGMMYLTENPDRKGVYKTPQIHRFAPRDQDPEQSDRTAPFKHCAVVHLSKNYNGEPWTRSFLDMQRNPRRITLPREYGQEFYNFVRWHELAHCMMADEGLSDMIAAKMMLKESRNIRKTLAFLELFRSVRIAGAVMSPKNPFSATHETTFLGVDTAVKEFKANGYKVKETKEELFSIATLHKNFDDKKHVSFLRAFMAMRPDITENYDFAAAARFLTKNAPTFSQKGQKDMALEVARGLRYLGRITGPVPKVVIYRSTGPK